MRKEKLLCPMSFNDGSKETGYQECFTNCAWWNVRNNRCEIVNIIAELSTINFEISRIGGN